MLLTFLLPENQGFPQWFYRKTSCYGAQASIGGETNKRVSEETANVFLFIFPKKKERKGSYNIYYSTDL